jgi:hypothetical protein
VGWFKSSHAQLSFSPGETTMSVSILLPLLVALAGVLVYAVSNNSKVSEIGRIAFAMGLLVALLLIGGRVIHF